MKTYRYNGERWHLDQRPLWKRIRQWVLWVGGWELANGRGWDTHRTEPWPVSILHGRMVIFGHWLQVRTPWGYLVVVGARDERGKLAGKVESAFISHNGTPQCAHLWLVGTPAEIRRSVETRARA